ncbi:DUF4974 domain-containing protein [Parabacteroides sp. GYB001]|uniref:FecR family protein n=1 Tax=Parabacteroides leei TaxID=2939491 RepID=UPI002017653B|nr:FecR family protein [Parabacteroides leei]MCL3851470.1 DUF4974 domain-containing protein [Parabacteroides leei]
MEEKEHISDHIIDYLLSGEKEVTDPVLQEWLDRNEENRQELERYRKIWEESGHYMDPGIFNVDRAWEKVDTSNRQKTLLRKRVNNIYYTLSGVAASVLLMVILSVTGVFDKEQDISVSLTADYGNRSEIALPDGSVVKLNSGSDITYVYNSKKKIREVRFQGEGYFDVSKSKTPFIVKMTDGVEVKVLGTSFNLKAYDSDPTIQASLVEGRIELKHQNEKLTMKAGEMAEFDKRTNKLKQLDGDLSHSYGWLNNKLYMDDMSLGDVCLFLERWYNVDIALQEGLGEKIHYNGVIQEETITEVLEALSHLSNIAYHVKGKDISITSK